MTILGIFLFIFLSKHVNAVSLPSTNITYLCQNETSFELSQQNTLGVTSLLSELVAQSSTQTFYSSSSNASGQNNIVYGQFYCTGNVDSKQCQSCVQKAANLLKANCNNYTAAIVYEKECTLRYSNNTVYGVVDAPVSWLYSTKPFYGINETLYSALVTLIHQAAYDARSKGFATGDARLSLTTQRLYTLAQCSPDILGSPCQDCLEKAHNFMQSCCLVDSLWRTNSMSVTIFLSSCQLGYEVKNPSANHGTPSSSPGMNVWYIMLGLVVAALNLN